MFVLTKFQELKNGVYGLPGLPWKPALLTAVAHDWIGLKIRLGGAWPTISGAMHWHKHWSNRRQSEPFKYIQRYGGLDSLAVADRLLEVAAERINKANDFSLTLDFDPTEKTLLAGEVVGLIDDEAYGERLANGKDLEPYLQTFIDAKLITRETMTVKGTEKRNGERVPCDVVVESITFPTLKECVDEYTEKVWRKSEQKAKRKVSR